LDRLAKLINNFSFSSIHNRVLQKAARRAREVRSSRSFS
jgi:hypothetical protein